MLLENIISTFSTTNYIFYKHTLSRTISENSAYLLMFSYKSITEWFQWLTYNWTSVNMHCFHWLSLREYREILSTSKVSFNLSIIKLHQNAHRWSRYPLLKVTHSLVKNNLFEDFAHRLSTFKKLPCSFEFLLPSVTIIAVDPYRLQYRLQGKFPTKKEIFQGRKEVSHPRNSIRNLGSIELPPADRTSRFSSVLHHFYARHISDRPNGPTNDTLFTKFENQPDGLFVKKTHVISLNHTLSIQLDYTISFHIIFFSSIKIN